MQEPDHQQIFGDRYEIVRHLARGGMAQVYLARDVLLDRPVALKALFPELSVDRSFVTRFRNEAKAAANLSHPNIVSVYDWGQGGNTYYIVMEYIDGPTVSSMLRSGPIAPVRAAAIAADVAAALDFAHRRGVIHRDVKPGNVLIDSHGQGQVKVADFGIARAVGASEDLTQTGSVMGTATYFSPEQAQGYPVDPRSDVYSLGVVLYEMVTGRAPFAGDNPVTIAYKHVKEDPVPAASANAAVPADLEAIIMRALAKDPTYRYQTAGEMREDLVRFVNGQPVLAAGATRVVPVASAGAAAGAWATSDPTRVQRGVTATTVLQAPPPGPGTGGPDEPGRSRRWLWVALAILAVALLGVGGYLIARHAGVIGNKAAKTLTVPTNLVNEPVATAQSQLHTLGFTNVITQARASSQVRAGNVVSTDPPPGTSMKSDAPLVLFVSSGPTEVTIPSVAGQPADQAGVALQHAGFVVTQSSAASNTVPQGNVISTNPAGGQKAPQGSHVTMVVSTGLPQVTIPTLVGSDPATAGQKLGALGLVVNSASEASPTIAAGLVTRTNPPAGASVQVGSTVTVYTSTGLPQVQVPNLQGLTKTQAQTALANAQLTAQFTTVAVSSQTQNGVVQSQNPTAGTAVAQGSTVNVVIGSYTPATTGSSTTTSTTAPTTSTT
jgi:serine/threonine-protein kinase